jgi:hypothetical protein
MIKTQSGQSGLERFAIAVILAVLGFLTGIISVWMLTDLPGIETGRGLYIIVASMLGIICFVYGYKSSDRTIDMLGEIWSATWKLSVGILSIIRSLAR